MDTDDWKEYRKEKHAEGVVKKDRNLINAKRLLDEHKVPYKIMGNGIHFVVDGSIDYYPTTGKWLVRKSTKKGRGIFNLLRFIRTKTGEGVG